MTVPNRLDQLLKAFENMPDISCPTCGREIYCGTIKDMCSLRPCGLLERQKQNIKKETNE